MYQIPVTKSYKNIHTIYVHTYNKDTHICNTQTSKYTHTIHPLQTHNKAYEEKAEEYADANSAEV